MTAPLVHQGKLPAPMPTTMIFVVVQRCNSRCNMCYIWENKNPPEVSVQQIRDVFQRDREDLKCLRRLSLTGGEPSLRSDLPELVEAVLAGAANVQALRLATHGMTPDRAIQQIQWCWEVARAAGVSQFTIQVSLDGIGEIHDRIRGIKGGGERVKETLHRLIELRRRDPAIGIALSTVVQPINRDNIPALQALARSLDIPIYFSPIVTSAEYYGNDAIASSLSLTGDPAAQAAFRRLAETTEGSLKFYYRDMVGMLQGQRRGRICMMGYHSVVLEADGDVHACVNSEGLSFGNLLQERFRDIWWGERAEQLRRRLHSDYCPTCPSLCYGSKPVNTGEVIELAMDKLAQGARNSPPGQSGHLEPQTDPV